MYLTCITHASARDKKEYSFRGLTEEGASEVQKSAQRFRELSGGDWPKFGQVISSPKARCLETALLLAKALSDLADTSQVLLDEDLKAGSIEGQELFDLANRATAEHVLVSGHADLAKALPPTLKLTAEAAKDGWFSTRPVLILIQYEQGNDWSEAGVLACQGLVDNEWRDLIQG